MLFKMKISYEIFHTHNPSIQVHVCVLCVLYKYMNTEDRTQHVSPLAIIFNVLNENHFKKL